MSKPDVDTTEASTVKFSEITRGGYFRYKEAVWKRTRGRWECSKWLHYCLQIGWPKSLLDDLEALWWKYHDDCGKLIASHD